MASIGDLKHPEFEEFESSWEKWRLTYKGGKDFVEKYVEKFSQRESETDFTARKNVSPCAAFAKAAINDVRNSIFQRMVDVVRLDGTDSYRACVEGERGGVDLLGSSMMSFMGMKVLHELLSMKKVGVYVDMPQNPAQTQLDQDTTHPYLYIYKAEDIRSWTYDEGPNSNEYSTLLLRETQYVNDPDFNLPIETRVIYKYFSKKEQTITVKFLTEEGEPAKDSKGQSIPDQTLEITRIPFYVLELSHSLLEDIADHQIALTALGSSDINYSLRSNFPFYVEQIDPRAASPYITGPDSEQQANRDINTGPNSGRAYPLGAEQPAFIHPSSEPLLASMQKQAQLKAEIRLLINLSISNLEPKRSSAESKQEDEKSLESGLSYIGLELEHAERRIAEYWAEYEASTTIATVKYPEKYDLKTDGERRTECDSLKSFLGTLPSITAQREIAKLLARTLLRNKVSQDKLAFIEQEIDKAEVISIDPELVAKDVELGLLGNELASKIRMYPEGEAERAQQDHTERLRRILIAQTKGDGANAQDGNGKQAASKNNVGSGAARGVADTSPSPDLESRQEKQ